MTQSCLTLWPHGLQHARVPCPSLSPRVCSTHAHWVDDAIKPSFPLLPPSPPAFNLSQNQVLFQWVDFSHGWPNYWSFSFSISSSNEYSELISFRIDWFDLLAVQETQDFSSTTVWKHPFFGAQTSLWSNSLYDPLLEWVLISSSRGSSQLRSNPCLLCHLHWREVLCH